MPSAASKRARFGFSANDFEALRIVVGEATKCASDTVKVTANQTTEHKNIQVPALKINPAEYTVAVVANNSIVPLLNDGLIRPLDELVAKYGQDLTPNQLIKLDGKVMAVAFMGNGQHLIFRKDILEKAGVQPPKTYEDVLAAAKAIKDKGLMEHPLAASDISRLGPRSRIRQHVHGLRRRVLPAWLRRAGDQQRKGPRHAKDHEGDDRVHGPRLHDLQRR